MSKPICIAAADVKLGTLLVLLGRAHCVATIEAYDGPADGLLNILTMTDGCCLYNRRNAYYETTTQQEIKP